VIKHCGSGFDLGGEDKDSSLFLRAGAEAVTMTGPKGTAVVRLSRRRPKDRDLAAGHSRLDIVFIEGGRTDPGIRTIEVVGLDPKNRLTLPEADRWIIVSRSPISSSKPIFFPSQVREIAALILSLPEKETEGERKKLEEKFFRAHDPAVRGVLKSSVVAIGGAGGLGSNVALALARAGVGTLLVADFDLIEASNLNRQQYFANQLGRPKVEALAENLERIPSGTKIIARKTRVTAANIARLFGKADILVEAFDRADQKQMLIEAWMTRYPDRPIVAASGLAGYGANNRIRERRIGLLTLIGDESSEPEAGISPLAPRVGLVAAMQANRVVEILMKARKAPC
jgi:sulfur carrier protein ThiS adenylyltransferase